MNRDKPSPACNLTSSSTSAAKHCNVNSPVAAQSHVEKARRDLELLETKRHAAELRMREVHAKEAAEAARQTAAEQAERERQQVRASVLQTPWQPPYRWLTRTVQTRLHQEGSSFCVLP